MPIRRTPSESVRSAVRRGLAMYDEGRGGDGLKPETVRRARSIAAGAAQSTEWLTVEAPAWFARHDGTRPEDVDGSPWQVAWLLWGGDAGRAWANREKERRARMEAAGETIMAMTVPTKDGQGLGDFLAELKGAARSKLLGPAASESEAWVRLEDDTVTGSEFVAELCTSESEQYFRIPYTRGDDGRIVLGDAVPVGEVTTYVTAESPPVSMGLVLESLPVHAPPTDGLTRGRPVQLLRVGPLHDPMTGAHLLDVTDDLCAGIALAASRQGYGVPVDMGHALYSDGDGAKLYGRLVEVEARPGSGLWGVPEWTEAGRSLLSASPGLYYLSPTLLGAPKDPKTGETLPGRMLHSVSLTARPRQDALESLALSQGAAAGARSPTGGPMAGNQGTGTPKPDDVVTLSQAEHSALLLAQTELTKVKADLSAKDAEAVTLAQRVTALEGAALARTVEDECAAAEKAGKVVGPALRKVLLSMPQADRATLLGELPASRPVAPIGHGDRVEAKDPKDPAVVTEAVKLAREKGIEYRAALALAQGVA
jgi:hypothetical protein